MATRRRTRVLGAACALLAVTACSSASESEEAVEQAGTTVATLYWLDVVGNAVHRATGPDFDDATRLVHPTDTGPDGVAVDVEGGRLYWSSMGSLDGSGGGTLQRSDVDGQGVERVLPAGTTHTPKQIALDVEGGHVYWCDREGATVWRAGLDGSAPQPLVRGHGLEQPVGIALDLDGRRLYFVDRTARRIYRTGMDLPAGQTAEDRTDLELLHASTKGAAMPVDLALDTGKGHLYWTDRFLGTVQRVGLDLPAGTTPEDRDDLETVVEGIVEPVGLALDLEAGRLYYSSLNGTVTEVSLDGEDPRTVGRSGAVSGVTLVRLPGD